MPEKAPRWAPLAAAWWEQYVGGGKDKSSKLRSNKPRKRSNKRGGKNTNALLAPVWMRGAIA
jgi:hypothetical protein